MRRTKFRAWNKLDNKMIDMDALCFIHCGSYNSILLDKLENDTDYIELMQYSGLEDKNEEEICEGDILKGRKNNNYKVVFENASFVCYHTKKEYGRWGLLGRLFDADMRDLLEHIEIIGNIYENKELLE